jgi:hydrogenase maturation protease
VDATPRGGRPGTLHVIDPDIGETSGEPGVLIEGHNMDPVKVLRLAATMGARVDRLLLVGCEPTPPDEADEMHMEMSEPVRAAVDEVVLLIEKLIAAPTSPEREREG